MILSSCVICLHLFVLLLLLSSDESLSKEVESNSNSLILRQKSGDPEILPNRVSYETQFNFSVNISRPAILFATELCHMFASTKNKGVCYFNAMNNIKIARSILAESLFMHIYGGMELIKNNYLNATDSSIFVENRHDRDFFEYIKMGTNKALLSVYDVFYLSPTEIPDTEHFGSNFILNVVNVCMVGRFSLRSLTVLLTVNRNLHVSYYIDGASYKDIYGMSAMHSLLADFKLAYFPFSELKSIDNCDIIHIVGGDAFYLDYIMQLLSISSQMVYNFILPYSSGAEKTIIWERDFADARNENSGYHSTLREDSSSDAQSNHHHRNYDSHQYLRPDVEELFNSNYTLHRDYIPDEAFMDAILNECNDSKFQVLCGIYKHFLNLFFSNSAATAGIADARLKYVSSLGSINLVSSSVNLKWIMNNTWQSYSKYCSIVDTDGFLIHCLCSEDYIENMATMKGTSHFLTEVAVGKLQLPNSSSRLGLARSKNIMDELMQLNELYGGSLSISKSDSLSINPTKNDIIVITYTIRVFRENAYGIQQALKQLGYINVIILPTLTLNFYHHLVTKYKDMYTESQFNDRVLQIAIAPHEEQMLLQRYAVIQMEQVWSPYFTTIYPRFKRILSHAASIWTFSDKLKSDMIKLGHKNVYEIPVYTDGDRSIGVYNEYREKLKAAFDNRNVTFGHDDDFYHNDVFMFGSYSRRRGNFFYALKDLNDEKQGMCSNRVDSDSYSGRNTCKYGYDTLKLGCTIGGFDVAVVDDERDKLVMRSKIIANIHTDTNSSLEIHRINYLLSLGKVVISERSLNDPELDSHYEDALIFLNSNDTLNEFSNIVAWILDDDDFRLQLENRAYRKYHESIKNQLDVLDDAVSFSIATLRNNEGGM